MKVARRFLSMLLIMCMLLSLLPSTVFAADSNIPFTDIKKTDWFYDAVEYVYENNMMSGTGNNQFSPNMIATRGMIVTILYRLEGSPTVSSASFDDVAAGEYHANGVYWAAANGIVSGYGNSLFGPNDPITREQMAAILYRYAQYKEYDTTVCGDVSSFTDSASVSSYAVDPMNWAVGTGLLSGIGNNMLNPTGNATRAQAATILMRFFELDTVVPIEIYTVTFDYNYGNQGTYKSITVEAGETVDEPADPTRSSYSFNGWYTAEKNGKEFDFDTAITSDITLYAKWSIKSDNSDNSNDDSGNNRNVYTVVFYLNDGSGNIYNSVFVNTGEQVSVPTPPVRDRYHFTSWYTDSNCEVLYDFSDTVNQNLDLYAGWKRNVGKITYQAPTENNIDADDDEGEYVNDQLIISAKDGTPKGLIQELVSPYSGSIVGLIETIDLYQIAFESPKTLNELNQLIECFLQSPFVDDAYLNTVIESIDTVEPYYPSKDTWDIDDSKTTIWDEYYPNDKNWGVEAINAPSAWGMLINEYGGINQIPRIHVGIIDSYIDIKHPDLQNFDNLYWYQTGLNTFKKDQTNVTAMEYAAAATKWEDYNHIIHGTHVAGTIGASFNNGGISGVALNPILYGISIAEARDSIVYTRFGFSTALSNLIEDSNCQIINYSQGYNTLNERQVKKDGEKVGDVLKKYLDQGYDFVIVTAAGNNNTFEAEYNSFFNSIVDPDVKSHIIVVGNAKQALSSGIFEINAGQNYGSRIDIVAPGTDIYSTVSKNNHDFYGEDGIHKLYEANKQYCILSGTSMAAPHVSGIAALVWAANPKLTGDEVKDIIINTANIPVQGSDAAGFSHNMVNAAYAVAEALGESYLIHGSCGESFDWILNTNGDFVISGIGNMCWDEEKSFAPWYRYKDMIQSISIGSGITSICQDAFIECQLVGKVTIPETVTSIGYYAFGDMPNLKEVMIPSSVETIEKQALGYIGDDPVEDFTIYGFSNTAAEIYASENSFRFVPITYSVSGVVKDSSTNFPLSDVDIYVYDENGGESCAEGNTNSDGAFTITLDEGGIYNLKFMKGGYKEIEILNIEVNTSVSVGIIQLPLIFANPIISGIVKDTATGLVLENVDVYVYDENNYGPLFTGKTGSNGIFSIALEQSGTYNLKFIKEGYEEYILNNTTVTSGTALIDTISLAPKVSSDDIIYISTPEQFNAIRNNLAAHYVLLNDINLSDFTIWAPIGTSNNPFSGILDGNGYSINGFTISSFNSFDLSEELDSKDDTEYCGSAIFGTVSNGAIIRNLNVNNASIHCEMGYELTCYGVLVGKLFNASIENCSVSGNMNISTPGCYAGGIVGYGAGTIKDCKNNCDITISAILNGCRVCFVGGILGSGGTNNVEHCYNTGEITTSIHVLSQSFAATVGISNTTSVGGIVGFGTAKDCANCAISLQLTANVTPGKCGRISGIEGNTNCSSFAYTLVNGQFVNDTDLTSIHGKDIATIDEVNNWYQNL